MQPTKLTIPDTLSDGEMKALQTFARRIIQFEYHYTRTQLLDKILKHVDNDSERARTGLYMLMKFKILSNSPGGKYVMKNK